MWESIHGEHAWLRYKDFEREVWVYWRVEMWRAWEARFTPEGRTLANAPGDPTGAISQAVATAEAAPIYRTD